MSKKSRKEQIEELLALDPEDAFLRYGLAMEYVSAEQDEEAVRTFLDLLKRDGDYVPAYLHVGKALVRLGRDEEAKGLLQTGIAVAQRKRDDHAAGEMAGFLAQIE